MQPRCRVDHASQSRRLPELCQGSVRPEPRLGSRRVRPSVPWACWRGREHVPADEAKSASDWRTGADEATSPDPAAVRNRSAEPLSDADRSERRRQTYRLKLQLLEERLSRLRLDGEGT
jgi:hypothetical protein